MVGLSGVNATVITAKETKNVFNNVFQNMPGFKQEHGCLGGNGEN